MRQMIGAILYYVLYPFAKLSSKRYVTVLSYHSVDNNPSFFTVSPDEFVRQMEYLRENYTILSLQDVVEFALGKRELPSKSVAITCDDGYYDNYLNVYPYANANGFPIAIFVTSGFVGKEMRLGNVPLRMLGWDEISEMSRNNVTIGAHTVSHPDLSVVDIEEAKNQMESSKSSIEEKTGHSVDYFAYPKGACAERLFPLLKLVGFKAAFATGNGLVFQGDSIYDLNRVTIDRSVSFFVFKSKLTVATEWYRDLERAASRLVHWVSSRNAAKR